MSDTSDTYTIAFEAARRYAHPDVLAELFGQMIGDALIAQQKHGDKRPLKDVLTTVANKHVRTVCRAVAMSKGIRMEELGGLMTVMLARALVDVTDEASIVPPEGPSVN